MKRISNNRVGYHIQVRSPFVTHTGSMYGEKIGDNGFVVYSYGPHWPLAFWNGRFWLLNTERSSVTTNRHNTIARLACNGWVGCPKIELEAAIKRNEKVINT